MNKEEWNTALYQKMFAEQEQFKAWLLEQPPEEILHHAYEYTMREDILLSLEYNDLAARQAAALLDSPAPLGDLYHQYEKMETSHMEEVWACFESRAEQALAMQLKQASPPDPHNAAYAREHGELEQYRASRQANVACKEAIEAAVREHFDGIHLGHDAASGVIQAHGLERVVHVVANTVQLHDWDGRYSRRNKEWAKTIPNHDSDSARSSYALNCHPAVLDGFIDLVREEARLGQQETALPRASVRQQLRQAQPGDPKAPAPSARKAPEPER